MVLRGERISNDPDLLDNLQVWAENDYDTRILHSNLAFPLLKKLTEVGDPQAKQVYKNEIAERFTSGYIPVSTFLISSGFLSYLDEEEKDILFEDFRHILHDKNSCLIQPIEASVWIRLADALRSIKKNAMALEAYERALKIDSVNLDAWNNRGVSFEQLGQYKKAIDS